MSKPQVELQSENKSGFGEPEHLGELIRPM
jgi:hypothetical protein